MGLSLNHQYQSDDVTRGRMRKERRECEEDQWREGEGELSG